MSTKPSWGFPESLQPDESELSYDLSDALDAVVMLRAEIPEHAFTASILGTERSGSAVVVRPDGLLVTIGYLIVEAESLWITTNRGRTVPGHALAYDFATGFGLVQPLARLDLPILPLGHSASVAPGDELLLIGHGGRAHALRTRLVEKREFAGYWEYVLDEALFTSPAHPEWGGAALVDSSGRVVGIGSLLLQDVGDDDATQGNMVVPIDLLSPIIGDLERHGVADRQIRPWLGMYTTEQDERLVVAGVVDGGPADRAGVQQGDAVLEVDRQMPGSLADFFRRVWGLGPAGVEVPLTLERNGARLEVRIVSADRSSFLSRPRLH